MSPGIRSRTIAAAFIVGLGASPPVRAHDGPPFPIVFQQVTGPYEISVWTDPDTTDDGAPGGQFWVALKSADGRNDVPAGTRAHVSIAPLDRSGQELRAAAEPVDGLVSRQFAALVMDHEGRFRVHVTIDGPLGTAEVTSEVAATYDMRPPPVMMALYLMPFLLIGFLWLKLMIRRRAAAPIDRKTS